MKKEMETQHTKCIAYNEVSSTRDICSSKCLHWKTIQSQRFCGHGKAHINSQQLCQCAQDLHWNPFPHYFHFLPSCHLHLTISPSLSPKTQGPYREGGRKIGRTGSQRVSKKKQYFSRQGRDIAFTDSQQLCWSPQDLCWKWPAQIPVQCLQGAAFLTEELLTVDSFWDKESQFSLVWFLLWFTGVSFLVSQTSSSGWQQTLTVWAAQVDLGHGGLKNMYEVGGDEEMRVGF